MMTSRGLSSYRTAFVANAGKAGIRGVRRLAGIETICVITGGFSEAELREAGAAAVYESVDDLRRDLENTQLS